MQHIKESINPPASYVRNHINFRYYNNQVFISINHIDLIILIGISWFLILYVATFKSFMYFFFYHKHNNFILSFWISSFLVQFVMTSLHFGCHFSFENFPVSLSLNNISFFLIRESLSYYISYDLFPLATFKLNFQVTFLGARV